MTNRILVPFAGSGAGSGPLSWGQRLMWNAMRRWDSSLAVGGVTPLPPGVATDQLAAVLGSIVSRHESLRTRITLGPDGEPRQEVAAAGQVALELVDTPAGEDPAAVADRVRDRYQEEPFDLAAEWPVRMALVRSAGVPVRMVVMYSHLALDGAGLEVLLADTGAAGPVTGVTPLAQAAWESGPAGQRHNAGTLRHWERHLRSMPARRFRPPADHPLPRFRELRARSRALELAARLVADRAGVPVPAVLLAASATALARVTGNPISVQLILVSNRFRAGFAESVSTVSQPGLCVVDTADVGFDELVRRAWRASLSAYKHAYCDPTRRDALHERVCAERGETIELNCYFNNRRTRPPTGPPPTVAEVDAARAETRREWSDNPLAPASEPFFVTVDDVADLIDLRINLDTRYVAPADAESYLHELESATVTAALDPIRLPAPR